MKLLLFILLLLGSHGLHAHAENNIVIVEDKDNSSTPVLFANVDAELAPNHPFDEYDEIQIRSKQNKRKKKKKSKKRSKKEGKGSNDEKDSNGNSGPATDAPTYHQTPFPTPLPTSEPTDPPQTPTYEPTHNPTPPPTSPPTTIAPSKQLTTRPTDMPAPSKSATAEPTSKACSNTEDFNLCIAIDMSGSVCNGFSNSLCTDCSPVDTCNTSGQNLSRCCSNFDNIIKFTQSLVSLLGELPVDQAFSVVHFGTYVNIASTLKSARQTVKALNKLKYSGGKTNMVGALDSCQTSFSASPTGRKNFILLITDGAPSVPDINAPMVTELAATGIKEQGTFIIPILIEEAANEFIPEVAFLRDRISSGKVFSAEFDGLADIQNTLVDQVCESPPLPTKKPTLSPTFSPSNDPMAPTPTTISCPPTLDGVENIDGRATLYYAMVPSDPVDANNGILCARLEVTGEQWVAFGVSMDGLMTGSEAVIGTPDDDLVKKYDMNGQSTAGVVPMEESKQTLRGTSLTQANGVTTMEFIKLLEETGEIPILASGENTVLYAYGTSDALAYHAARGSFKLDFAPTSTPDGSIYYTSFEESISFPDPPVLTTTNADDPNLVWELSTVKANSGVNSIRSPDLYNAQGNPGSSNATITTPSDWSSGQLKFSLLGSVQMPLDKVEIFVDGTLLNSVFDTMPAFVEASIPLSPGSHIIDVVYAFNPLSIPESSLPSVDQFPNRIGAAFIDDIYFVPDNVPPTAGPAGSTYYTGFEDPAWPQQYPEWTTTNDDNSALVWDISDENPNTGVSSMKSPVLDTAAKTRGSSTLTLTSDPNGPAGSFYYSVFAGNNMPLDNFEVIVDGNSRGSVSLAMTAFEERVLPVGPGGHTIDFVYTFNPAGIPAQNLPPGTIAPNRIGAVYIDDVYFVPLG